MTINKAKASEYTSVKPQYVADYIKQYSQKNNRASQWRIL